MNTKNKLFILFFILLTSIASAKIRTDKFIAGVSGLDSDGEFIGRTTSLSTTTFISASTSTVSYFNAGNVAIGTTTATTKLHVEGDIKALSAVTKEVRAVDSSGLKLYDDSSTLGIHIRDGGYVGIGVLNPSYILDIFSPTNVSMNLESDSSLGTWWLLQNTKRWATIATGTGTGGFQPYSYAIRNDTDGINAFTILPTGFIGIGTTNPTERLQVEGNIKSTGTVITQSIEINDFITITPSSEQVKHSTETLTVDGSYILAKSTAGANFLPSLPNGIRDGDILIIECTSDTDYLIARSTTNVKNDGDLDFILLQGSEITYRWKSRYSKWDEINRSTY